MHFLYLQFEAFTDQPGARLPADFDTATATPLSYLNLLFPPELISLLVKYTNMYAASPTAEGGDDPDWRDTTEAEMRAYLGVNILMGLIDEPKMADLWNGLHNKRIKFLQKTLGQERFTELMEGFNTSDCKQDPQGDAANQDPLHKVREFLDVVSKRFTAHYCPSRELSIESIVKSSGDPNRLGQRSKSGHKLWMLCDTKTAYCSGFCIDIEQKVLGYEVASHITKHLHGSHRWVFLDDDLCKVSVLKSLLSNGLYACGVMSPKNVPKKLKEQVVASQNTFKVLQLGDTVLTGSKFLQGKPVYHLSTLSDPSEVCEVVKGIPKGARGIKLPHAVFTLNRYVGPSNELIYRHLENYAGQQTKKWWHSIFFFLFNSAIFNAFVIYKEKSAYAATKKNFQAYDFRHKLAIELIGGYSYRKHGSGDPSNVENVPPNDGPVPSKA